MADAKKIENEAAVSSQAIAPNEAVDPNIAVDPNDSSVKKQMWRYAPSAVNYAASGLGAATLFSYSPGLLGWGEFAGMVALASMGIHKVWDAANESFSHIKEDRVDPNHKGSRFFVEAAKVLIKGWGISLGALLVVTAANHMGIEIKDPFINSVARYSGWKSVNSMVDAKDVRAGNQDSDQKPMIVDPAAHIGANRLGVGTRVFDSNYFRHQDSPHVAMGSIVCVKAIITTQAKSSWLVRRQDGKVVDNPLTATRQLAQITLDGQTAYLPVEALVPAPDRPCGNGSTPSAPALKR